MNFALVLVLLSLGSGFIYLLDVLFWAKKRKPKQKPGRLIEYSRSFFPIFLIVLLLRSFLVEPFRIPSGSLEPTLQVGDFVAVNKFAYGLRLPVIEKKSFLLPRQNAVKLPSFAGHLIQVLITSNVSLVSLAIKSPIIIRC
ncbi:signal peptidase I [Legionella oakridgensis ATCC 33761 = DSM 21215]|uniref:Signal peptidase I n=1 Tax=Legionella oakridgensis ATCC 33761 = DSM 21215 TaxID=1268635 RepID=W0BCS5_9GAMM|nr:signal peptidase I [Legionella oakridgensis ATCC 33761 = DSM 21215]